MINIEKCYYINLLERQDRKSFIEKEINKSSILSKKIERFEAVNGYNIHPRDLSDGFLSDRAIKDILLDEPQAWGLSITQGALGVYLSYISLFELIQNKKDSCVLIEDDSVLSEDFDEFFLKIQNELPEDFDICYLGYGESEIESKNFSENLVIPCGKITCLPAMIVSPKGARKLIQILKNVSSQIDTEIYMKRDLLNIFVSKNKIAEIKNSFGSNIQGPKNCKKTYKKQNYIFSTIAYGDLANTNAMKLAMDLDFFDQKILIITNKPGFFSKIKNVIEFTYPEDFFSYNKKLLCFQEGFKYEDGVVYIDADTRIFYKDYKETYTNFLFKIPPGFHPSWCWGSIDGLFLNKDVPERADGYGNLAKSLCKELEIKDTSTSKHWQEGIIAISKENNKEQLFLELWNKFSSVLDKFEKDNLSEKIGLGEGNIIGLCATKSELTINEPDACNKLGKDLFYNFWEVDKTKYPDRKIVKTSESKIIKQDLIYVNFEDKKIDLSYRIYETPENLLIFSFDWNTNRVVDFLDHEFRINDNIYHFTSEKNNEFIIDCSNKDFIIYHTYDWYGKKDWKKILSMNEVEEKSKKENYKIKDVEIHSLICNKDIYLAINCIKSLIKYEEFTDLEIYFHDDGSLTESDKEILKELSSNVFLIDRKTADNEIRKFLSNYPNCLKYRLGEKNDIYLWHKIKSFDYFFFSKTKKILGLDTDLLFLNKPSQLIEFINNSIPCYFPDVQSAYCFNEPKNEIKTLPNVNTGLIYIPGEEYYNISSIEKALSNLIRNEINYFPSWIEQSAFAHMFYVDGRYKSLDIQKNRIPFFQDVDFKKVECLHFVSYPAVRKLYKEYITKTEIARNRSLFLSKKQFFVDFKDKKVPLELEIYKTDKFYEFEFEWKIESVGIDALSHQFKIVKPDGTENIHEFGSLASGFFICNLDSKEIKVYHTYEWYGEKIWKELNI